MRVIGLTGGIASGKSTVREMLEQLGAWVLDADAIYHGLIAPTGEGPSPLACRLEGRFPGILGPDGEIDRKALSARVFAEPEERRALEAITHPAVAQEFRRRSTELAAKGERLLIYDVPLLYERGLEAEMQGVIVVWVPREMQLHRVMSRDGIILAEAEQRLAAQLPLEDKRRRATWVIDNSGSIKATRAQVQRLWDEISHA